MTSQEFQNNNAENLNRWNAEMLLMSNVTDALDLPVDEGIKEACVALQCFGVKTCSSCEGHEERLTEEEYSYPYIRVSQDEYDIDLPIDEIDKVTLKAAESINSSYYTIVQSLLFEFYSGQNYDFDLGLTQRPIGFDGTFELVSCSVQQMRQYSLSEKKIKLKQYQEEINRFKDFMKKKFLQESPKINK
jgi:hypothetical protein